MNGNTPHAGLPGIAPAGKRDPADMPEITADQKRALRAEVTQIAARTRKFLPDEYVVNANVSRGVAGPRATVAVDPPIGEPVSAGFSPDLEDVDEGSPIPIDGDPDEVARGLAAGAVLQVKQSLDDVTPTAR